MADDYRNTKYCPEIGNIEERKNSLLAEIRQTQRGRDMHRYLSQKPYKEIFLKKFCKAYNDKCAYCGVSLDILSTFEIDHFIPRTSCKFDGSKAAAGDMKNLVLACRDCNRWKSNFDTSGAENDLHPDYEGITKSFVRDSQYYIRVSKEKADTPHVNEFYTQLRFDHQMRRVDYLLMSMRGLYNKMKQREIKPEVLQVLSEAIRILQEKRNRMWLHTDAT